jgi:hypothetical protein
VIDHLEALGPCRIVDPANVDQHLEQALRVVAQGGERRHDLLAPHRHGQLAQCHAPMQDRTAELGLDVLGQVFERHRHALSAASSSTS